MDGFVRAFVGEAKGDTHTVTLGFVCVDSEPSVASHAHGRAILGTGGAGLWRPVVACAFVDWDTHAQTNEIHACSWVGGWVGRRYRAKKKRNMHPKD